MRLLSLTVAALALAACTESTEDMPTAPIDDPAAELGFAPGGTAKFTVTVYNLSDGQPLTPPLAATHKQSIAMFEVGEPASAGIQAIAENGNADPLKMALEGSNAVSDVVLALETFPPIVPGGDRSFDIYADGGAKWFSMAVMLICTNDGFTGVDSQRLPKRVGETVTVYADGYDAGTEDNTEAWEDLVPPCAMITGFGDQGGTGMSNPALAEDDVIRRHPNIDGSADLEIDPHRWTDPVAKIVIERVE